MTLVVQYFVYLSFPICRLGLIPTCFTGFTTVEHQDPSERQMCVPPLCCSFKCFYRASSLGRCFLGSRLYL